MSFFSSRRSYFLNISILLFFMGGWFYSYMSPVIKGLLSEEDGFMLKDFDSYEGLLMEDYLFYGTVTHASVPSIFGGTNLPFFDKVNFKINEDDDINFVLYASQELMDEMSDWFSFGGYNAGSVPLEIVAARVNDNTYVVHGLSSTDGDLDVETLIDYQFYYTFLGVCLEAVLGLLGLIFMILWLAYKKKPVKMSSSEG